MPVEILELIVRANVHEGPSTSSAAPSANPEEDSNFQKQVMIEECVEQVLKILKHREER